MSDSTDSLTEPGARPAGRAGRFDQVSIALHWLTVLLVLSQFTTAWLVPQSSSAPQLLFVHRSTGIAIWLVIAARLFWRHRFADLPPFPASMPMLQRHIAKLNEYGLYVLLLVQPLTGLGNALFRGRPLALFFWTLPPVFSPQPGVFHVLSALHELGADALLALVGFHAAAALLHGIWLRDGVLQRMLPWTPR